MTGLHTDRLQGFSLKDTFVATGHDMMSLAWAGTGPLYDVVGMLNGSSDFSSWTSTTFFSTFSSLAKVLSRFFSGFLLSWTASTLDDLVVRGQVEVTLMYSLLGSETDETDDVGSTLFEPP